jgi:glutathione synthase/RimK-type ligase-like ATP-grasp enzyme
MINIQDLTEWEYKFLKYYLDKFKAKWVRVFNNKHPLLATRVDLYTVYKRKLKHQPITESLIYSNMFKQLDEGKWYFIPNLLKISKED